MAPSGFIQRRFGNVRFMNRGNGHMTIIARRFIIIALVFAIFAMLLAAAVARSAPGAGRWPSGHIAYCTDFAGKACQALF